MSPGCDGGVGLGPGCDGGVARGVLRVDLADPGGSCVSPNSSSDPESKAKPPSKER